MKTICYGLKPANRSYITILTDEQLAAKNTRNLLFILKAARKASIRCNNRTFCETCRDHHPLDSREEQELHEMDMSVHEAYFQKIKSILATREHVA